MFALGIVWLTQDLRLRDNPLLQRAARECRQLLCLYCLDTNRTEPNRYGLKAMGAHRKRFLRQALAELDSALRQRGQYLHLVEGDSARFIARLLAQTGADVVYHNRSMAHDERRTIASLRAAAPEMTFTVADQSTLFELHQLPFDLADCPPTFSQFRKRAESIAPPSPTVTPQHMPPSPFDPPERLSPPEGQGDYTGGEAAGLARLDRYLWRDAVRDYKQRRNALDAWYLSVYVDAIEWVEMPNTRGMSQFADGGLISQQTLLRQRPLYPAYERLLQRLLLLQGGRENR